MVQLANVYFDAERWPDAISWYEQALALNPKDPDVSTDLGVSYYYTNRTEEALKRFEESLKLDPKHTKTLLNIGIVRAFGKQDLEGAAKVWQEVIDLAPSSPEAGMARQALQGLRSAHPPGGSSSSAGPAPNQPGK